MRYVDKEEIADFLGISTDEVLRRVRNRQIPFYKLGHRTLRFDLEEVKNWIQSKKVIPIPIGLQRK